MVNLKWPHTAENGMRPWYGVAWCLPWWCVYKLAIAVACIALVFWQGFDEAVGFWRNN